MIEPRDNQNQKWLRRHWKAALDVLSAIAVLVAAGVVVAATIRGPVTTKRPGPPEPPLPAEPLSLAGAAQKGGAGARAVMIEYSDFQCPFCGKFSKEILPQLQQPYLDSGQLRLAFRHFPLEAIHTRARKAAEAAECARRQGRFWEAHDRFFGTKDGIDPQQLAGLPDVLGLNNDAFGRCVSGDAAAVVQADITSGRQLGITGTPAFLLGTVQADGRVRITQRWSGVKSVAEFRQALNALLVDAQKAGAPQ